MRRRTLLLFAVCCCLSSSSLSLSLSEVRIIKKKEKRKIRSRRPTAVRLLSVVLWHMPPKVLNLQEGTPFARMDAEDLKEKVKLKEQTSYRS